MPNVGHESSILNDFKNKNRKSFFGENWSATLSLNAGLWLEGPQHSVVSVISCLVIYYVVIQFDIYFFIG